MEIWSLLVVTLQCAFTILTVEETANHPDLPSWPSANSVQLYQTYFKPVTLDNGDVSWEFTSQDHYVDSNSQRPNHSSSYVRRRQRANVSQKMFSDGTEYMGSSKPDSSH